MRHCDHGAKPVVRRDAEEGGQAFKHPTAGTRHLPDPKLAEVREVQAGARRHLFIGIRLAVGLRNGAKQVIDLGTNKLRLLFVFARCPHRRLLLPAQIMYASVEPIIAQSTSAPVRQRPRRWHAAVIKRILGCVTM